MGDVGHISKWKKIAVVLILFGLLLWNPLTRQIIILILPLGSGIDDLIMIGVLVIGFAIYLVGGAHEIKGVFKRRNAVFAAIIGIAFLLLIVAWIMFS